MKFMLNPSSWSNVLNPNWKFLSAESSTVIYTIRKGRETHYDQLLLKTNLDRKVTELIFEDQYLLESHSHLSYNIKAQS